MCTKQTKPGWGFRGSADWRFKQLQILLEEDFTAAERDQFFGTTLPGIVKLALMLPWFNPGPWTLNPEPRTLNHEPRTMNSEP